MKSLEGACGDFDPDRDTDKTFGPGCEIMVVWSGGNPGQVTSEI